MKFKLLAIAWIFLLSQKVFGQCVPPTQTFSTDITDSSFTANWVYSGSAASNFEFKHRLKTQTTWQSINVPIGALNSVVIDGYTIGDLVEWHVKVVCEDGSEINSNMEVLRIGGPGVFVVRRPPTLIRSKGTMRANSQYCCQCFSVTDNNMNRNNANNEYTRFCLTYPSNAVDQLNPSALQANGRLQQQNANPILSVQHCDLQGEEDCSMEAPLIDLSSVAFFVGIEDEMFANLSVYPNPATSVLYLSGFSHQEFQATLFNLNGQEVLNTIFREPTGKITIENLPSGVYDLRIRSSSGREKHYKIVKQSQF